MWSRLLLLTLLVVCVSVEARNPSRECRICEDVAQTYHDVYQCAGNSVDMWGPGDQPTIPACEQPKFACDKLSGDIAQACASMESSFVEDDSKARTIWMSQMEFGRSYETCVKLNHCEADPNPEEKEYTPCHEVFASQAGKHDILNPAFTSNCTEECYLCGWLVREWPLFQEICTPDDVFMANSIDPDRTVFKQNAETALETIKFAKEDQAEADAADEAAAQGEEDAEHEAALIEADPHADDVHVEQQQQHQPSSDDLLMNSVHANWEHQAPYEIQSSQSMDDSGSDESAVFVETSSQVKLNSMQRAWSKHTTKAIQSVLQAQANDGITSKHKMPTGKNTDLLFSQIREEADDDTELGPKLDGQDLKKDCFTMWRYFVRSRKAKFFTSWKRTIGIEITPADIERSNLWDANIACKCLGQCGLDAFEHLGLIKQCRYDEQDRTMMEYAYPQPH